MKDTIKNTFLLTATCLVASGLLAAVFQATKPTIEMNKFNKEIEALRRMVTEPDTWSGLDAEGTEVLSAMAEDGWVGSPDKVGRVSEVEVWVGKDSGDREICRVLKTSERGYSSDIKMLVAVSSDGTCKAVTVLDQNETPGLGTNIMNPGFQGQFKGKNAEDIKLRKNGGRIDAITGATISSTAAVGAVRKAMEAGAK